MDLTGIDISIVQWLFCKVQRNWKWITAGVGIWLRRTLAEKTNKGWFDYSEKIGEFMGYETLMKRG
jgi:hypothetical protein